MRETENMHTRRFSMLILGVWIGLSIAMVFVAIHNFSGVDRLLEAPASQAAKTMAPLGHDSARMLLRYQASELNRYYFETFGDVQIALAILFTVSLLFATNGNKPTLVLCGLIFLVVLFQRYWLTPEITYLGRLIDFVSREAPSQERARFWSFHNAFSALEMVKLGLLAVIGGRMLVRTDRAGRRRRSVSRGEDEEALASAAD